VVSQILVSRITGHVESYAGHSSGYADALGDGAVVEGELSSLRPW
jgi:hypothetical protein